MLDVGSDEAAVDEDHTEAQQDAVAEGDDEAHVEDEPGYEPACEFSGVANHEAHASWKTQPLPPKKHHRTSNLAP